MQTGKLPRRVRCRSWDSPLASVPEADIAYIVHLYQEELTSGRVDTLTLPILTDEACIPCLSGGSRAMLTVDTEQEDDGRWVAEIAALPGAMAYGASETAARQKAAALAFRIIADRLEHRVAVPDEARSLFALA